LRKAGFKHYVAVSNLGQVRTTLPQCSQLFDLDVDVDSGIYFLIFVIKLLRGGMFSGEIEMIFNWTDLSGGRRTV